jgi:hypothetical protein
VSQMAGRGNPRSLDEVFSEEDKDWNSRFIALSSSVERDIGMDKNLRTKTSNGEE